MLSKAELCILLPKSDIKGKKVDQCEFVGGEISINTNIRKYYTDYTHKAY